MKNKILILVSVILVVVAIGGYFWYWQNYRNIEENNLSDKNSDKNNESQSIQTEIKNERQIIPAKMSDAERFIANTTYGDYKIFSDKLLGFSFQYPNDWEYEIKKDPYNPNHYSLTFTNEDLERVNIYPTGRDGEFLVCRKSSAECAFRILVLFDKKVIFRSSDEYIEYFFSDFMFDNSNFMIEAKTLNKTFRVQIDRLVKSFKFCAYYKSSCQPLKNNEVDNIESDILSTIDLNIENWATYKTKFGFSFKLPKDVKVTESAENKTVYLRFKDIVVMMFDTDFSTEFSGDMAMGVDWSKMTVIENFMINGEPVELITHNQPDRNDDWTFPSDCSYYVFKNYSSDKKLFFVPSCTRNNYMKEIERKVVESVRFE